jgi:uncharacterized cupredoxin-like copper-binding protein
MRPTLPRLARLTAPAVALVVAVGCGAGDGGASDPTPTIRVTERDFRIDAPKTMRAGAVTFMVRNRGPVAHELIVVRRGRSELPLRPDNVTVDEDALEPVTAGALEPAESGGVRALRVRLAPGRYELLCNMSGHFLGGMHTELVVH